ncbi:MAG: ferrous iron transport protein B [Oleiphilaceae bacterium]|jgi:ferrous iron transport protein B
MISIKHNFIDMLGLWSDPLGLSSASDSAESQGIHEQTLTHMTSSFDGQWDAFYYSVLILLYTPYVAVLGAIHREAGSERMWVVVGWTTLLSYGITNILYQVANITKQPLFSTIWIVAALVCMNLFIRFLKRTEQRVQANLIKAVTVEYIFYPPPLYGEGTKGVGTKSFKIIFALPAKYLSRNT